MRWDDVGRRHHTPHSVGTLDRATSGDVNVAGHDVASIHDGELTALRSCHIGFVFRQFFLLAKETGRDNVADGLLCAGVPIDEVDPGSRSSHMATKLCVHIPPVAIVAVILADVAIGTVPGLYPPMRAARMSPTEALRRLRGGARGSRGAPVPSPRCRIPARCRCSSSRP